MALSNAQYDEIMRAYDKRQLQNKFIHEKRIQAAYKIGRASCRERV